MKCTVILLSILFLSVIPAVACAQSELLGKAELAEKTWGGVGQEWEEVSIYGEKVDLYYTNNVRMVSGPEGQYSVILKDNSPEYTGNTELLLSFDRATRTYVSEESGYYDIDAVTIFPSDAVEKHGQGSAGFLRYENSIEIRPLPGSIFFDEVPLQSFTIDFHLYTINVHDSVVVLSWYVPTVDTEQGFSGLKAYFHNGRLHWEFSNVFHEVQHGFNEDVIPAESPRRIVIGELDPTPLNEWHHHAIHYDSRSGLITLRFDGRESNLYWATADNHEEGKLLEGRFSRHIGVPMTLGDHFLGYIDEFRISKGSRRYTPGEYVVSSRADGNITDDGIPKDDKGSTSGEGFIISDVIDLKNRGTKIVSVSWDSEEEMGTALRVFFRVSNEYFAPNCDYLDPNAEVDSNDYVRGFIAWRKTINPQPWVPVRSGEEISIHHKGRFLQWMVVLFGTEGLYTPALHNLTISFEPNMPPTRPILLAANPVAGGIELKWVRNKEKDLEGYKIYYGNRSGYYVGNEPQFVPAVTQDDPESTSALVHQDGLDTRTFVLYDLENEDVYFVSITAVDEEGQESDFSRELIARPSALYSKQ
jgi:hypothetical protein